ncbi:MAG: NUDIX hydrolase [Actinomycetota bacterium]|nr:NUDIX hydrolase [Actinomycetota bacterium]
MSADLTPISEYVVRVSWTGEPGFGEIIEAVRAAIQSSFEPGSHRVEAHIDPSDVAAQRIATFSGLRKEGISRGVADRQDRIVYARLASDVPVEQPEGFRALLNSFLPRKRAISQLLVRDHDDRVLLCQLTYKNDWDLPGGVVEVGESPQLAVRREVEEELGLSIPAGPLLLTDWMPPWSGWDDALCLVFDGGVQDASIVDRIVRQEREIRAVEFLGIEQFHERCADFTARRLESALVNVSAAGPSYVESGGAAPLSS